MSSTERDIIVDTMTDWLNEHQVTIDTVDPNDLPPQLKEFYDIIRPKSKIDRRTDKINP